tara:strand:+ start:5685 stop:6959 length:1275 start_codon:yes stop_codon:yes gene_type:complete
MSLTSQNTNPKVYYGWFVVAIIFYLSFLSLSIRTGFGAFVGPLTAEFGWDRTSISLVSAIGWLTNGVTQPWLGGLYDKYGGKLVIIYSLIVFGIGTIFLSMTMNIWFLGLIWGLVLSTAQSGLSPVTFNSMISKWFSVHQRGKALGIAGAGSSTGQLILVPFTMYLILTVEWRLTWFILGLIIIFTGLPLAYFFLKDRPSSSEPQGTSVKQENAKDVTSESTLPLEVHTWPAAFRSRPMWLLIGGFFICGWTTGFISTHFVQFAREQGVSAYHAANAFGLIGGLNIISILLIGTLSDRFGRKDLLGIVYAVRGIAYGILVFFKGTIPVYLFAATAGMSWLGSVPLTTALTGEIYGLKKVGTLTGAVFLSHQVGAAISIYLAGWFYDQVGTYDIAFLSSALLLILASIWSFAIQERKYSAKYITA